jgi:hypothetical protein
MKPFDSEYKFDSGSAKVIGIENPTVGSRVFSIPDEEKVDNTSQK